MKWLSEVLPTTKVRAVHRRMIQSITAWAYRKYGEAHKSVDILERMLATQEAGGSEILINALGIAYDLSQAYRKLKNYEKAIETLRNGIDVALKSLPGEHADIIRAQKKLSYLEEKLSKRNMF